MMNLVIDGTDAGGCYETGLDHPPYAVFDIEAQEFLVQGLATKAEAERRMVELLETESAD